MENEEEGRKTSGGEDGRSTLEDRVFGRRGRRNIGRTAVSAEGRTEEKHLLTPLSASLVGTPPISVPAIALRGPCVKSYPL